MTPAAFAKSLAAALRPALPAAFSIRADGAVVRVDSPDGLGGASTLLAHLDPDEAEPDDYADAAWNVLSMVQDVISETTTDPWPAAMGPSADLAEPGTRVEGRRVVLFYGPEEQPVLVLAPMDLDG